ncbi:MAG: molybdenum cofactor biosynthesis protein B [Microcystaceae cyanobacterium]
MLPHPDRQGLVLDCAVLTLSDSRTVENDLSGQRIQSLLIAGGHRVMDYQILPDEPSLMRSQLITWGNCAELRVIICNGGTGIAPRDQTYEVLAALLAKELPGFGELFRFLSYQEIGSRAIASRALAGVYQDKLIFALPGSVKAVQLAMEKLILPEMIHLTTLLPKNL